MIGEYFPAFRYIQNDITDNYVLTGLEIIIDYLGGKALSELDKLYKGINAGLKIGEFMNNTACYQEHMEREEWETNAFAMVLRENGDLVEKGYFDINKLPQQSEKAGDFTLRPTEKLLKMAPPEIDPFEYANTTVTSLLHAALKKLNPKLFRKYGYNNLKEEEKKPARVDTRTQVRW